MPVNRDLSDLFKILFEEKVEYLISGAHAVSFYAQPRYTKDIDILINPTKENATRVWRALERFGAPNALPFWSARSSFNVPISPL